MCRICRVRLRLVAVELAASVALLLCACDEDPSFDCGAICAREAACGGTWADDEGKCLSMCADLDGAQRSYADAINACARTCEGIEECYYNAWRVCAPPQTLNSLFERQCNHMIRCGAGTSLADCVRSMSYGWTGRVNCLSDDGIDKLAGCIEEAPCDDYEAVAKCGRILFWHEGGGGPILI